MDRAPAERDDRGRLGLRARIDREIALSERLLAAVEHFRFRAGVVPDDAVARVRTCRDRLAALARALGDAPADTTVWAELRDRLGDLARAGDAARDLLLGDLPESERVARLAEFAPLGTVDAAVDDEIARDAAAPQARVIPFPKRPDPA